MSGPVKPISYNQSSDKGEEAYSNDAYIHSTASGVYKPTTQPVTDFSEDENKERGNWSGRFDFFLSCLGYAVGLGNVWRFPYLCYQNGGGVFFIPYVIMLFLVGIPIFFLELSLGQFSSQGPLTCWRFSRLFSGLGYGMVIVSGLVAIYYNMIIGWALYYLFASFTDKLPWEHCDSSWKYCTENFPVVSCNESVDLSRMENGTCYNGTTLVGLYNATLAENYSIKAISPSEEYFNKVVLGVSEGIENIGEIQWHLALCLLLAWVIVFFCLLKGIKSSGKVVYFTAIFPYVVLVILFVKGLTLEGHAEGIKFYLNPDFSKLYDAKVWKDAAVQIFFSLGASWGGLIALSSYNRFHNNCFRDALIVSLGNCLTSFFAGFVIFSYLGFMAFKQGVDVDKVATGGAGLAFIVYPEAVTLLPAAPVWSILFFFMLLTLGLDSQFTLLETVLTSVIDLFPTVLRPKKSWVILGLCIMGYLLGLTMCTNGGIYMLQLMDTYAGGWAVLMIGIIETSCIAYVYGFRRFLRDIGIMLGREYPYGWQYWSMCWLFLTPALIMFVMVFSWVKYERMKYGDVVYPAWAEGLGWCMSIFVVLPIFVMPIYLMFTDAEGSFSERFMSLLRPTSDWGPALVQHRRLITYAPGFIADPAEELDVNLNSPKTIQLEKRVFQFPDNVTHAV